MPITISKPCVQCQKEVTIIVPKKSFLAWQYGTLIQHAMPNLSIPEREFLISNLCPSCQDAIFSPHYGVAEDIISPN